VTDLERFFRQLVQTLAAADAGRLRQPIAVAEIPELMPYRTFRRTLELDSSEDYELVLLRLCAGEGGFARTEPPELRASFQAEVASPNPDLSVLESGASGEVTLSAPRVALALATTTEASRAYAPPPLVEIDEAPAAPAEPDDALPLDEVRVAQPRRATPAEDAEAEVRASGGSHCSYCGGSLPEGRVVNYCPHCGQSQAVTHCPECHSEVEIGWRHCISCGYALGG
jgi:double zinc ribbon protein